MISIKDIFNKMKLKELNVLIKMFSLNLKDRRKAEVIEVLSNYMENNIKEVLRKFIIEDELMILKDLCDNNYEIILEDKSIDENIKSLRALGIVDICEENKRIYVCIPVELKNSIRECLYDTYINEFSRCRGKIIKMFCNLLELYGAFTLDLLEDYIVQEIGQGYRIHRAIETIHTYNERNNIYIMDENMVYYNSQIRNIEIVKKRFYSMCFQYRYYDNSEIENVINSKDKCEDNIYIILNRVYRNSKDAAKVMNEIKFMLRQGNEVQEIGEFIKTNVKRISSFGIKNICRWLDIMKDDYIIWGLKGYSLSEAENIKKRNESEIKAI